MKGLEQIAADEAELAMRKRTDAMLLRMHDWQCACGRAAWRSVNAAGEFRSQDWVRVECAFCSAVVPLGPANDSDPRVKAEIRAAELAADMRERVGVGGHRPEHCTGEHCWHYYDEDDYDDECCYCRKPYQLALPESVAPGIDYQCQAGYLAAAIAHHDESRKDQP